MLKYQLQKIYSKQHQAGFTIIESLVAVIVLGILMTAIAPTILISAATRVQSRRVELATQAARAYIDGVNSGNIPAPPISSTNNIKPPKTGLNCKANDLKKSQGYCSSPTETSYRVFCVDGTGDGACSKDKSKDLIVQAFGFNSNSTDAADGYRMGVRVYRADAFEDNKALISNQSSGKKVTQSTFTGGLGKRKAPLLEMVTEVSNQQTNFQNFCTRLDNNTNRNSTCNN
ncbi:prepilin-type N-terminal cleavage/methylation domain-containing protein [Rivularia sp. PCC 7116]|uniref:hormogonium polysaccharide secretion pseudopilin HpsB n=1 Tax=Rivularia sp. PCC 7116 TaxID=373994 RepID=UPI00029EE09B|nr:hormogonium polysaccharide secretion pseudopilin HpsB [Rivularia sp. PCC 7116]AFY54112.1 prepilin-type N-terminal cleavage/methylation domain-containing protein [Rivularia sp. PCC 7116]